MLTNDVRKYRGPLTPADRRDRRAPLTARSRYRISWHLDPFLALNNFLVYEQMHGAKVLDWPLVSTKRLLPWQVLRSFSCSYPIRAAKQGQDVVVEVSRTRNIGIIAHIDAVRPRCVI